MLFRSLSYPDPHHCAIPTLTTALSRPSPLGYPGPHHGVIPALTTALSRFSPLRPPHKKLFRFIALSLAACTSCSFLQAASLRSPAGCMRFLYHTGNRTTGSHFPDLNEVQMKFLFLALNIDTLTSYIIGLAPCFANSLPSTNLDNHWSTKILAHYVKCLFLMYFWTLNSNIFP